MPLPTPNLDDRRFQDLVDEAKRAIPTYCPEWTDHNVHDPGVTLIELFAHMVETMIYRLNRVPEKSQIAFMDLMGVRLQEASAARTDLTFWLTAPAAEPVLIPAATEVSTVQTAGADAVTFSTDRDLSVLPPQLRFCLTSPDERSFTDWSATLEIPGQPVTVFDDPPAPGNAFYLGFESDLSSHLLALDFDIREIAGTGIEPGDPPISWEAFCKVRGDSSGWLEGDVEYEQTTGLNQSGQVAVHLPPRMLRSSIGGIAAFWVRCRFRQTRGGQAAYRSSPRVYHIAAASYGATVSATHAITVREELLGRSTGLPGQRFQLQYLPVLPRRDDELIEVEREDGGWEPWREREHFGASEPDSRHVQIDGTSGLVCFGPIVRSPGGGEQQYGAIPPAGARVRMRRYRSGGGAAGNVGVGKISVLRSAVPFVDRVRNRSAAVGGRDAETIDHAAIRAPQMLRTSFRAVTADDYEHLARQASQGIARVRCLQPRPGSPGAPPPGSVRLLLVPSVARPEGRLTVEQLRLPEELRADVQAFLDDRRLLATSLEIATPSYTPVQVQARLKARPRSDPEQLRAEVEARLYRFINPILGGHDGAGWEFGRDLFISEIFAVIQGVPGVEYVEVARMLLPGQESPTSRVSLGSDGLPLSGEHTVIVVA